MLGYSIHFSKTPCQSDENEIIFEALKNKLYLSGKVNSVEKPIQFQKMLRDHNQLFKVSLTCQWNSTEFVLMMGSFGNYRKDLFAKIQFTNSFPRTYSLL